MSSKVKTHDPIRDYGYIAAGLAFVVIVLAVIADFVTSANLIGFFE